MMIKKTTAFKDIKDKKMSPTTSVIYVPMYLPLMWNIKVGVILYLLMLVYLYK